MKQDIKQELGLPEGIDAKLDGAILVLKGFKGEFSRDFKHPKVELVVEGTNIIVQALNGSKREKKLVNTFCAHIKNMFKGVNEGHVYKMKLCSGHFPMTAAVNGKKFVVKNFLGEKIAREMIIKDNVKLTVTGEEVLIKSISKEAAGQVAADIEQLTKVGNRRDVRIFQDGIYITEKDGKVLS